MMIKNIQDQIILKVLFFIEENTHYGLKVLFQFQEGYLYFNSVQLFVTRDENILRLFPWEEVSPKISRDISIRSIREDELTNYFFEFSNGDIFYIYQQINADEAWTQAFKVVGKHNLEIYAEIKNHMNEEFVEDIILLNVLEQV